MTFTLAETLDILERTPVVLDGLLRDTSPGWHRADEGPETWSAFDVVGHLIHGEETNWVPRARMILRQGDRTFEPFEFRGSLGAGWTRNGQRHDSTDNDRLQHLGPSPNSCTA